MGYGKSHELKKRVFQLEQVIQFLYAAETEIRYTSLPLKEIMEKHGGALPFAPQFLFNLSNGISSSASWEDALKSTKSLVLTQDDLRHLKEFGVIWGSTDTEGQLASCRATLAFLKHQLENAQKENETKSKLYQTLGLLGGIGSAILLG